VGGLKLEERASDLAIALCIASCLADKPLPKNTAVVGELGLTGELRSVSRLEKRVQECARLGFDRIILPKGAKLPEMPGVKLIRAANIRDAVEMV